MADTKQISATLDTDLVNWIKKEAKKENRTFSNMIEILLNEAKKNRDSKNKLI